MKLKGKKNLVIAAVVVLVLVAAAVFFAFQNTPKVAATSFSFQLPDFSSGTQYLDKITGSVSKNVFENIKLNPFE